MSPDLIFFIALPERDSVTLALIGIMDPVLVSDALEALGLHFEHRFESGRSG
jgi:hypothetical protein